jgi:hypothetical protein
MMETCIGIPQNRNFDESHGYDEVNMFCVKRRFIGPLLIICFILSNLTFLNSCQTVKTSHGTPSEVVTLPNEIRLRERVQEFHDALGNNDIAAWYAMTSPTIRERMTFEEFKKDFRWDENAAQRSKVNMRANLEKECGCVQFRYLRCVLVINVKTNESGRNSKTEKPLEMWEYADGEWFWGYMGPDSRGKCPGEN